MRPASLALFYSHYLDHMTNTDSSGNKETITPYLLLNSQRPPNECKSLTQRYSHSRIVKVCLDFRGQKKIHQPTHTLNTQAEHKSFHEMYISLRHSVVCLNVFTPLFCIVSGTLSTMQPFDNSACALCIFPLQARTFMWLKTLRETETAAL